MLHIVGLLFSIAAGSHSIMLHIVGLLPAVGSLIATPIPLDSIISLTWTPPFSLDIPGVDPDIIGYCVSVVNSTSSLVIHSQCGITDTQYDYTVSPRSTPCDNYTFTVTPVNIVGNGTSASVTRGILPSGELVWSRKPFTFYIGQSWGVPIHYLCSCVPIRLLHSKCQIIYMHFFIHMHSKKIWYV